LWESIKLNYINSLTADQYATLAAGDNEDMVVDMKNIVINFQFALKVTHKTKSSEDWLTDTFTNSADVGVGTDQPTSYQVRVKLTHPV